MPSLFGAYRSDYTRAIGSNQPRLALGLQDIRNANHVMLGDTFGDTDNESNFRCNGLLDTLCCKRGRYEDCRRVCTSLFYGIGNTRKHWPVQMCLASLLWVCSTNNIRPVLNGLSSVECSLLASETLEYDLGCAADFEVGVCCSVRGGRGSIGLFLESGAQS